MKFLATSVFLIAAAIPATAQESFHAKTTPPPILEEPAPEPLRAFFPVPHILTTKPRAASDPVPVPTVKPAKPPVRVEHAVIKPGRVLPPDEFDHYAGEYTVTVLPDIAAVNKACNNPIANLGCAKRMSDGTPCQITLAADDVIRAHGAVPEIVLRHELGHCAGWPALHPAARTPKEAGPTKIRATKVEEGAEGTLKRTAMIENVTPVKICGSECLAKTTTDWLLNLNSISYSKNPVAEMSMGLRSNFHKELPATTVTDKAPSGN